MMKSFSPVRVCLIVDEAAGPGGGFDVGSEFLNLARFLTRQGYEATILSVQPCRQGDVRAVQCVEFYRQFGITLVYLPECSQRLLGHGHGFLSYRVHRWLESQDFSVVHFEVAHGSCYYSLLARAQGLAFANVRFCVSVRTPILIEYLFCDASEWDHYILGTDFMEKKCVELADVVTSPSDYLFRWMTSEGWKLPADCRVLPELGEALPKARVRSWEPARLTHLAFYNRCNDQSGLELFCEAVKVLCPLLLEKNISVAILGDPPEHDVERAMGAVWYRVTRLGIKANVLANGDTEEQLHYLASRNALVVLPSRTETSALRIATLLRRGIPCIASDVGGTPEFFLPEHRERHLFQPNLQALCRRLVAEIHADQTEFAGEAALAHMELEVRDGWRKVYRTLSEVSPPQRTTPRLERRKDGLPKISVCISHRNRPDTLAIVLASVHAQTFRDFEVILVDDGSDDSKALAYLDHIESDFRDRGWKLLRRPHRHSGATRNFAATHARGEYLLFMDDDNEAVPEQLEVFAQVAEHTDADILSCFVWDSFEKEELPGRAIPRENPSLWLPLGGVAAIGFFGNFFGDTNSLIKRSAFEALNGFTEDFGIGHDDWEFFAKAALANYNFQVVPKPLFWYRRHPVGITGTTCVYENSLRSMRPYREAVPSSLWPMLYYAMRRQGVYNAARTARAKSSSDVRLDTTRTFRAPETEPVAFWDPQTAFATLDGVNLGVREETDEAFCFASTNTDPILYLPLPPVSEEAQVVVRLEITVAQVTHIELFYLTETYQGYSQKRKLEKGIGRGRSVVYFTLPPEALLSPLRLDPGDYQGNYALHCIEIRTRPRKGSPQASSFVPPPSSRGEAKSSAAILSAEF